MIFKIVLMAKNWSKLRRRARPQQEWAAGSTARSLQRHRAALVQAAELLSELENALCPIASTSLFHFQAVTRTEATISSISHLAYSKLEWVGFSLAYKWATGSRMSTCWDYRLDIIEDSRAWPWNKVQGSLLGSYTVQRENWVHRNVMQISWHCLGSGMRSGASVHTCSKMDFSLRICVFWGSVLGRARCTPSNPTPAHVQKIKLLMSGGGTQHPI